LAFLPEARGGALEGHGQAELPEHRLRPVLPEGVPDRGVQELVHLATLAHGLPEGDLGPVMLRGRCVRVGTEHLIQEVLVPPDVVLSATSLSYVQLSYLEH